MARPSSSTSAGTVPAFRAASRSFCLRHSSRESFPAAGRRCEWVGSGVSGRQRRLLEQDTAGWLWTHLSTWLGCCVGLEGCVGRGAARGRVVVGSRSRSGSAAGWPRSLGCRPAVVHRRSCTDAFARSAAPPSNFDRPASQRPTSTSSSSPPLLSTMASPSRPQKRAKAPVASSSKPSTPARAARLFAPFRALGFITTALPLAVQSRASARQTQGPKVTIVSSLGSSWAMWDGDKMGLLFVGPSLAAEIRALAVKFDEVFAAVRNQVVRFERGKEVCWPSSSRSVRAELLFARPVKDVLMNCPPGRPQVDRFTTPGDDTVISQLLIFGTQLLALTDAGDELLIFNLETTGASSPCSLYVSAERIKRRLMSPCASLLPHPQQSSRRPSRSRPTSRRRTCSTRRRTSTRSSSPRRPARSRCTTSVRERSSTRLRRRWPSPASHPAPSRPSRRALRSTSSPSATRRASCGSSTCGSTRSFCRSGWRAR